MTRFLLRTVLSLCCALLFAAGTAPISGAQVAGAGPVLSPEKFLQQVESATVEKLALIEERLQLRLEEASPPLSDRLRDRLILLSMWGPLAGCSQWCLETLGDSSSARKTFFFAMPLVRWLSAPFIFPVETAGPDSAKEVDTVFRLIAQLRERGFGVSLDNVGDASLSVEDARSYRLYYRTLIERFIQDSSLPELAVSLKFSALVHDLESAVDESRPDKARAKRDEISAALVELLQAAHKTRKRVFIRIDMEEYAFKDMTLQIFRDVLEHNTSLIRNADGSLRLGVVIQAYLRDSAKDVVQLTNWARSHNLRVPIRLVKGAYLTYEREQAAKEQRKSPVWNFKPSTDACYEGICAYMLLNRDAVQPAFATHNIRSQAHVMALADALGVPAAEVELQMLYGMGDPIKDVAVSMGCAMREYIPAGSLARGLKYAGRRFRELANSDNALARTMRGDFTSVDGTAPAFKGAEDQADGRFLQQAVLGALGGVKI